MTAIAFRGLTPFLKTMDLARTIDFYVNLLGFVVDCNGPPARRPTASLITVMYTSRSGTDPQR